MKKIFLFLSFVLIVTAVSAQDGSWIIKMNTKQILLAKAENETTNTLSVKKSEWKKNGFLEISFRETDLNTWKRSFLFFDEEDNQLLSKENTTYSKITVSSLRTLFNGKKEVRIYTVVAPVNPNIAIRIRRVHLCTLKLP